MIRTVIIQPPLVQLNTPYPSGAYLSAFFKDFFSQEHIEGTTHWLDLSTELFHKIFCKDGLSLIFEQSENEALKKIKIMRPLINLQKCEILKNKILHSSSDVTFLNRKTGQIG